MPSPEFPYLAAGAVSIVGGIRREKAFPSNGVTAVVATTVLVIAASATAETKAAPLVHAIGLLLLMGAIFAATRQFQTKSKRKG